MGRKKKAGPRRKVARRKTIRRSRRRLSSTKKFAIARVYLAGITASQLAAEFKVSPLSIYMWGRAVKKAKGKNPFKGDESRMTPLQKRLLEEARKAK